MSGSRAIGLSQQKQEWFYLENSSPVGPFTFAEVIRLMQKKQISKSCMVWRQGMSQWEPITKAWEFQPQHIRHLVKTESHELVDVFEKRKFSRVPFVSEFFTHNENQLWKAMSYEIGMGGIGLIIDNKDLKVGDKIHLHISGNAKISAFVAIAEIVNKSEKGVQPFQARYGLEFIDISREAHLAIQDLTTNPHPAQPK